MLHKRKEFPLPIMFNVYLECTQLEKEKDPRVESKTG